MNENKLTGRCIIIKPISLVLNGSSISVPVYFLLLCSEVFVWYSPPFYSMHTAVVVAAVLSFSIRNRTIIKFDQHFPPAFEYPALAYNR